MKFFFELVSCCGTTCRSVAISTAVKPAEEQLVPLYAASAPVDSRRRRQTRRSSSGFSGDWRPALNAISEDNDVVERGSKAVVGGSETITKKRKVNQSIRKIQGHNYGNDDYRRAPFGGAMVPVFSPTPFFF